MYGDDGADRFVFTSSAENPGTGLTGYDRINDFSRDQGDHVDLSAFDAVEGIAALDAFTFIGTGTFSGTAGERRYETANGISTVFGDVNGDAIADWGVIVSVAVLTDQDFILA